MHFLATLTIRNEEMGDTALKALSVKASASSLYSTGTTLLCKAVHVFLEAI